MTVVLLLATSVLLWAQPDDFVIDRVVAFLISLTYATVGLIVVRRVGRNRTGWILLAVGLLGGFQGVGELYPSLAVSRGLPGAIPLALLGQALFFPWLVLVVPVPALLFPDGHLPSPPWRWFVGTVVAAVLFLGLGEALAPGTLSALQGTALEGVDNPLGVDGFGQGPTPWNIIGLIAFVATFLGAAVAIVARFRRSTGEERQQLKWFAYAAVLAAVGITAYIILGILSQDRVVVLPKWLESGVRVIPLLAVLGLPISIGLAIVRYRLYDIDRLISRTIGYGILVGVLAGVYSGGVFLLRSFLPFEGNLAVAVSTLAIAGLFNPLRRRVQTTIDHRFFRSSYDARRVVEQFSARLRDQVELDVLTTELLEATQETMNPTSANVWLRPT